MTVDEIWVVKMVFFALFGIFAIGASFFTLYDACRDGDQGSINAWFRSKWKRLEKSPINTLPEKCIWWVLGVVEGFIKLPVRALDSRWFLYGSIPSILLAYITYYFLSREPANNAVAIPSIISVVVFTFVCFATRKRTKDFIKTSNNLSRPFVVSVVLPILYLCFLMCLFAFFSISFSLRIPLPYSTPFMLALTPLCLLMISTPLDVIADIHYVRKNSVRFREYNEFFLPFVFAVCISFSVTYFSFLIGNVANPEALVPRTFSMLLSNALFDGLTMVVTLAILRWAIAERGVFRLPLAIGVDIFLCSVLACGSLYFGLYFSDYRLSPGEVVLVLFGRAPDNSGFELGPCFWAMHTTFLPTLFYLSFILFVWVFRGFLYPVRWLFGVGQTHKNPLKLTYLALGLVSTIFLVLSLGTGQVEKYVKAKHVKHASERQVNDTRKGHF
jgi:hypothetical protein